MQQKFLSNLIFLVVVNLLVKPFYVLGIDRAVQNEVGAEAYGSYFALFNLSLILNIFLDLGITNYNNRNISQHGHLLGKYFTRIVALRFVLAVFYSVLCMGAGLLFGYDSAQMAMLSLLCINQFLTSSVLFLRSNVAGLHLFRLDSMLSVLDRTLLIIGCGILLWAGPDIGPFRIEWFVWMQTAALLLTMLVALAVVLAKGGSFTMRVDTAIFRTVLRQSLPFALLILLMSVYGRIDSVMLERMLPDGDMQAGIYAQAFRLLDAVNMIGYLFAGLLLPMFSKMLKQKEDIRPLTMLGAKLLLLPTLCMALISALHGTEIMSVLYAGHEEVSGRVLALLMFSFMPMAGTYVFGTLLTANGSLRQLNIIALIGVIISLTANLILIPEWGPEGAAMACLLTQGLTFALQAVLAVRLFGMKVERGTAIVGTLSVGAVLMAGFATHGYGLWTAAAAIATLGLLGTLALVWKDLRLLTVRH